MYKLISSRLVCIATLIICSCTKTLQAQSNKPHDQTKMNTIANLKTVELNSASGPVTGILMGLNIRDSDSVDEFIKAAAEKFKLQRMTSPPETTKVVFITIIGEVNAQRFAKRWKQLAAEDKILGFFMSQMQKAEVVHGTQPGKVLDSASLLSDQSKT